MKMFSVVIAGCRDFDDADFVRAKLDHLLQNKEWIEVLHGGCKGVDRIAEAWAQEKGHWVREFSAKWDEYGNSAGPIRNREMAELADACIAFWDNKSRGTKNMIDEANKAGIPVKVVPITITPKLPRRHYGA